MFDVAVEIQDAAWKDSLLRISHFKIGLPRGSIAVVVGSSGTGKSTLLKAIAGWHKALSTKRRSIQRFLESAEIDDDLIAYMPQDTEDLVLPWYSVLENLEVACNGRNPASADVRNYALRLGLHELDLVKRPRNLSGGMERRLALGMVLLQRPTLLLLDEPFTGLDADLRMLMWDHLHWYVHEEQIGSVVLMVTHSAEEAVALATHVIRVRVHSDSRIVFEDALLRPNSLIGRRPESLFNPPPTDTVAAEWAKSVRCVFASTGREAS